MKRVHHALIVAWAEGSKIESLQRAGWMLDEHPNWHPHVKYRIKLEEKSNIVFDRYYFLDPIHNAISFSSHILNNVRFTFDSETRILTNVEIIK